MEKPLPADSKVKTGEVWAEMGGCEIFPRTDELWRCSLDESPGTDKFSTPRISQIRRRPPAHTNITQNRDKVAKAAAADVHVHLMKERTLQQNFWTPTLKLVLTSTTLPAWIKGVPINTLFELYFPHLISLIWRKKEFGTVSLCLPPSHTGFFPVSNLLLILTLNLNDL